jgi:predicted O-methyltransferase YrrM
MKALRRFVGRLPVLAELRRYVRGLEAERDALKKERDTFTALADSRRTWAPVGRYDSPLPDLDDVRRREAAVFGPPPRTLPGIELRETEQLALLEELAAFYPEQPFPEVKTPGRRYWFENPNYSYADALFLYAMLRHARPRRLVEIGSGFSSAATLDVNELFLNGALACTFVEQNPSLLESLLTDADRSKVTILPQRLQDVDTEVFAALEKDDVLFVDSSHVLKLDSDVNHILFRILPALAPGVLVHFHDVFFPFEYPRAWAYEGRAWNEDYALRAFLQYNAAFEIVLYTTFLETFHPAFFEERMPLCTRNPGGSLWIRRSG